MPFRTDAVRENLRLSGRACSFLKKCSVFQNLALTFAESAGRIQGESRKTMSHFGAAREKRMPMERSQVYETDHRKLSNGTGTAENTGGTAEKQLVRPHTFSDGTAESGSQKAAASGGIL